eukprot:138724-Pleurochrysis_carterae.AAC.1
MGSVRLSQDAATDTGRLLQEGGGGGSLSTAAVFLIVAIAFLVLCVLLFALYRGRRLWSNRLRSAKVLDEIEMEFVNDDDGEFLRRNDVNISSTS